MLERSSTPYDVSQMMPATILLVLVAIYMAAIVRRGRTFRLKIGHVRRLHDRAAILRGWAMGTWISFGLPAALGLLVLNRAAPAWETLPPPFLPLVFDLGAAGALLDPAPLLIGMVAGSVVNALLFGWLARSGRRPIQIGRFPDVKPTTRRDLLPAIALSISAGVSEELFFRLFVPLLIALVSGSPLAGFATATLLFGAVHRYQGWRGVIATTLVGAGLAYVYLATGALWLAILFHIVIDLNALVVRPAVAGAWRVRP